MVGSLWPLGLGILLGTLFILVIYKLVPPRTKHSEGSVNDVIFLDIDGVLNSTQYWHNSGEELPMNQAGAIDPRAVNILNTILAENPVHLILSSSWTRLGRSTVETMLKERGLSHPLMGVTTPIENGKRWQEIEAWLSANEDHWNRFVVLDDDVHAWNPESKYAKRGLFASTNYQTGLTVGHIPIITHFLTRHKVL